MAYETKELLYTASQMNAEEAYRLTLINKIVPASSLMDEALKLANTMMEFPPHGLKIAKRCVNDGMQVDLNTALKLDFVVSVQEMSTPLAQENRAEGLTAFREKRKPKYKAE